MKKSIMFFKKITLLIVIFLTFIVQGNAQEVVRYIIDNLEINGHPGYAVCGDISGEVDKVVMIVPGNNTEGEFERPEEEMDDLAPEVQAKKDELAAEGWDFIYFSYVEANLDLKENAENVAHFVNYLNSVVAGDYHLAIAGGSMGGIVVRTMFVQENSNLGIDTYVSVDSPHHGVELSDWVGETFLEDILIGETGTPARLQMYEPTAEFAEHYGWLRSVEASPGFMENIINPMNTCAIAYSNGESSWYTKWDDISIHNKFYPISSYVSSNGLKSTYMPYHTSVMMDDWGTSKSNRWGKNKYWYNNTHTSYFDTKILNPTDVHKGHAYAVIQAIDYVLSVY